MKTPKKTIQKDPSTKPLSKKEYDEEDDLRGKNILDEDEDFDLPLDDIDSFDDFDDEDDDSY